MSRRWAWVAADALRFSLSLLSLSLPPSLPPSLSLSLPLSLSQAELCEEWATDVRSALRRAASLRAAQHSIVARTQARRRPARPRRRIRVRRV